MPDSTASAGFAIERRYREEHAHYEQSSSIRVGESGIAGVTDPMLVEPIDFEAEIAERQREYEPLEPVDGDLRNSRFGI
jgi:hypothetical protein